MSHPISLEQQQKLQPNLKQMQRLMMSQQMQQALHYLQLPSLELQTVIEQELEENPVIDLEEADEDEIAAEQEEEREEEPLEKALTFDENDLRILERLDDDFRAHFEESSPLYQTPDSQEDKWHTFQESLIQTPLSLFAVLMQQAAECFAEDKERAMAEAIIGNFDARGFLQTPLEEIALLHHYPINTLEQVLKTIQTFEPTGVGAQNLQESLLIQLKARSLQNSLAHSIVKTQFEHLLKNQIPLIKKNLKCSQEALKKALDQIAQLDLRPGNSLRAQIVHTIRPDVTIKQEGDEFIVEVDEQFIPSFRFNRRYLNMLHDEQVTNETKDFIKKKMLGAKWLLRTLFQRNSTLERIAHFLCQQQKEFFSQPEGKLIPLTMKAVAQELELNESTIARCVANKYVETPRGLLPLRSFFTTALTQQSGEEISSHSVRELMLKLIQAEDKKRPLSDEALAQNIQSQGIQCARRTVAKYRLLLKIGNAHQRKQY